MLKVGLTGGIGSGKTVVSEIFSHLGIPVFNADEEAKVITGSPQILKDLRNIFGSELLDKNGSLNRKMLRDIIFKDDKARDKVNRLIHPLVKLRFDEWCAAQVNHPFILKEAAILFESGTHTGLDKVIVVSSPEKLRIQRVVQRDGVDEDQVKRIISNQMDENEKIRRADFIIVNDEQQLLVPQVLSVFNQLKKLAGHEAYDV